MKILFAIEKDAGWNSIIDSRLGRAVGFMVYWEENNSLKYISNEENIETGHGAGIQAGQLILNTNSDVLICGGSIGPKAFEVINKGGVKIITQTGNISIEKAYKNYKENKYSEVKSSDK